MSAFHSKQRGVASIIFVLTFPLLFSVFVLAVESTRYLQTHARINDGVEMASLAVAANVSNNTYDNQILAKGFVDTFAPDGDLDISDISIERLSCDQIYGSLCGQPDVYDRDGFLFTQYKVTLKSDFTSWFPEDGYHLGYEETMSLGGEAKARKYQGFTIDVAFVADFSGSMQDPWNNEIKYRGVVNVISEITERLEEFNNFTEQEFEGQRLQNKVAFIGYNNYPHNGNNFYSNVDYIYNFTSFDYYWWQSIPLIDYAATARDPINNPRTIVTSRYVDSQNPEYSDDSYFYTLQLTDDFSTFRSTISTFYPDYGTSSYEGIIEAAKIVDQGQNVRKLIIVLSDGEDSIDEVNFPNDNRFPGYAAKRIYDNGLCQNIISDLESKKINGSNVEAKIFVIGFGYDIEKNPGLKVCAGEENIESADSYQQIFETVLELISEEVGRLYFGN